MSSVLRIGERVVDPKLGTVSDDKNDTRFEPRTMQVLVYLAEHAGDVVYKDAIFEEVWQGTLVTDEALTNCISTLRQAFQDSAQKTRFVQIIPKKGYWLIAPVLREVPAASTEQFEASPYPGLAPFSEADSERLFGRDEESELLVERVRAPFH